MNHYLAINHYRSSTDHGFVNTWAVRSCTRAEQIDALRDGLPVTDIRFDGGTFAPFTSTNGVRLATRAEIREYKAQGYITPLHY
jgi:hypothetical protein